MSPRQTQVKEIRSIVNQMSKHPLVTKRRDINVGNPPTTFDRAKFWNQLVGCLCSTRQKVNAGSRVSRFLESEPFPLALDRCEIEHDLLNYLSAEMTKCGIRFVPTISSRLEANYKWLAAGGWVSVEKQFQILSKVPIDLAWKEAIRLEREACRLARELHGLGPKQSRNLWVCLGLTRYSLPLDSRVMGWFGSLPQPLMIDGTRIGNPKYYDQIESEIQDLCQDAQEFPCVVDAAIFASADRIASNDA